MSCSTVEHFSHPQHSLVLNQDVIIGVNAKCSVCDKSVIGSPAYTCTSDDIVCRKFYLHKSCAELPKEIFRENQDMHPLTLLPRSASCTCDVCSRSSRFAYSCVDCNFDVCVVCAFISTFVSEEKVISHQGHKEHSLTLQRRALFNCDACWEKANDYCYVCITCDFWIHKKCALSPLIIPAPMYHHHPLTLIFSIPVVHRYFCRDCHICKQRVQSLSWSYYCHKCTFFVHIKCSMSAVPLVDEIGEHGSVDDEPDLVQFPLPDQESLFDLIVTQCIKLQVEIQGEGEKSTAISRTLNDSRIIKHWSHRDHPLELHQVTFCENELHDDDNDSDDDRKGLICNGCIQPITVSQPHYYACIQCHFFLHAFCATRLPLKLPRQACPFYPRHPFKLGHYKRFYAFFQCGICGYYSNGFYYKCAICDFKIDIRCAFLPTRIRHKSHKQHSLVQRPFSNSECSVSNYIISRGVEYACETCRTFQIHIFCVFHPGRLEHRYDDHPLSLKHPLFFYEGVIYCEICEDQVNNQWLLYHCDKCDHSFHHRCIFFYGNVKLGGTVKHRIDNQQHTLTLVLKSTTRRNSSPYLCVICGRSDKLQYFFECDGCGYLACIFCIRRTY